MKDSEESEDSEETEENLLNLPLLLLPLNLSHAILRRHSLFSMRRRFIAGILIAPLLFTACGKQEDADDTIGVEEIPVILPQDGKAVHPDFGLEQWFAFGAISNTGEIPANGVAQAYFFEGEHYALTGQVNVPPAEEGNFYEAWLENSETGDRISAGHLANFFGDARHQAKFEMQQDLRDYLTVIVTLEPDDGDPRPAMEVARGTLKVTER